MLDTVFKSLRYRSFLNGSKTYVDVFQKTLPPGHRLHLSTPVQRVTQYEGGASLQFADNTYKIFDHVVLAIHANQALSLLGDEATDLERKVLGTFKTSRNVCFLHSDTSVSLYTPKFRELL